MSFKLFIVYTMSFFLHLPARVPALGAIRFDFLLFIIICLCLLLEKRRLVLSEDEKKTIKIIALLLGYIFFSLPFIKWQGSVLFQNLPTFIKAVAFLFLSFYTITSEKRLRVFMAVFMLFQTFRVLEPLYLNAVHGYWGSRAFYAGGSEFMNRLAGAPSDVINPNGLAYVIASVFPFLHYYSTLPGWKYKVLYVVSAPLLIYALFLTGSRSGFLAFLIVLAGIVYRSKRKAFLLMILMVGALVVVVNLSDEQVDRYVSIVDSDAKQAGTAVGRIQGIRAGLEVWMERPIFGFGLGTSPEASFNIGGGRAQIVHNLYVEILMELGVVGLLIFLWLIGQILVNFAHAKSAVGEMNEENSYIWTLVQAMQVWVWMNLLFSFATYGLSTYPWYLFAGLSAVVVRLTLKDEYEVGREVPHANKAIGRRGLSGSRRP